MQFAFIDEGEGDDEAVVVGPFATEQDATDNAGGRVVVALLTLEEFQDDQAKAAADLDEG